MAYLSHLIVVQKTSASRSLDPGSVLAERARSASRLFCSRLAMAAARGCCDAKRRRAGLQLGQRREDFELGALLGRGSYACVYRARSRHSGDEVAIKIIEKQLIAASPGLAERVRAEAETHIALDHPSIVKLLTFFEDSSCVYLVLELCEGGELYHHLRRSGGGLPEGEARDMLLMLLEGMNYLHAQNIVHRDLKLSNLLLTKERRVKISDFGLSTVLEGQCGESGTMCGTPNYMPPEVIADTPHGLASDLWSLGCLLYTLLVASPPFESPSVEATLDRIARVDYSIPPSVSANAADLITSLLRKNPHDRPSLTQVALHPFLTSRRLPPKQTSSTSTMPASLASSSPSACVGIAPVSGSTQPTYNAQAYTSTTPSSSLSSLSGRGSHRAVPCKAGTPCVPSPHASAGAALRGRVSASHATQTTLSKAEDANRITAESKEACRPCEAAPAVGPADASPTKVPPSGLCHHKDATGSAQAELGDFQVPSNGFDAPKDANALSSSSREDGRRSDGLDSSAQPSHAAALNVPRLPGLDGCGIPGLAGRAGARGGSFLSARSHTIATPVQSARSQGPQKGYKEEGQGIEGGQFGGERRFVDARGLPAKMYNTRHASVRVCGDGSIEASSGRAGQRKAVLVISPCGIWAMIRGDVDVECDVAVMEWVSCWELTGCWMRLLIYTSKVIAAVRSRTPKVIYHSPHATSTLMMDALVDEPDRPASFRCSFYDGGTVVSDHEGRGGLRLAEDEEGQGRSGRWGVDEILAHANECLAKCRSAEKAEWKRRRRAVRGPEAYNSRHFPLVLAHREALHRVGKESRGGARHAESRGHPPSYDASLVSISVSGSALASGISDGRSRASTALTCLNSSSSASQMRGEVKVGRGSVAPGFDDHNLAPNLGPEGRVFDFAQGDGEGEGRPVVTRSAFFPRFGWVMVLEDGCHWALFVDGSQMVATDSHVVCVSKEGERSMLLVEGGMIKCGGGVPGHDCGETTRMANNLLSLRQVL